MVIRTLGVEYPTSYLPERHIYAMTNGSRRSYPGGKGCVGVYQKIINCMPPHETYIEPFLGGGSVLLKKKPAQRNFGIDLDNDVVRRWRVSNPEVEVIHGDALQILGAWPWCDKDRDGTLVYCDPPYIKDTRLSKRRIYHHDLPSIEDHKKLLHTLKTLPCMVMVSGYSSPLYDSMIGHWRRMDFRTKNRAGRPTIETIWMNFSPPFGLHDYQYLGHGFRDRERIKRKRERWMSRLLQMPRLERDALITTIKELTNTDASKQELADWRTPKRTISRKANYHADRISDTRRENE
jgi:DNA adenine methylase